MNTINRLCTALDRLHARRPVTAFIVAILIAVVCTIALALLNADDEGVGTHITRTV